MSSVIRKNLIDFKKATALIASENGIAAFAFYPMMRNEWIAGGTILTLHRPESDDIHGMIFLMSIAPVVLFDSY